MFSEASADVRFRDPPFNDVANAKYSNADKDMVKMFEEAYKQQPHNEELGIQNFFANVRASQWKSAQLVCPRVSKRVCGPNIITPAGRYTHAQAVPG